MTRPPVTAAAVPAEAWPLPGASLRVGVALRGARHALRAGALLWWGAVALDAWSGRQPWWAPALAGLCLAAWLRLTAGPVLYFGTRPRMLVWHPGTPGPQPDAAARTEGFFDEQGQPVRVEVVLDTGAHLLLRLTLPGLAAAVADHRWVPPQQLPSVWRWRLLRAGRNGPAIPAAGRRPAREVASLPHLHANTPSLSSTLQSPSRTRPASIRRPA